MQDKRRVSPYKVLDSTEWKSQVEDTVKGGDANGHLAA